MPQITIQEVIVEDVKKGKSSYQIATVTYLSGRGESKSKKVVSFGNPAVFQMAKNAKAGEQYEVSYIEGDQFYNWSGMKKLGEEGASPQQAKAAPAAGKVVGSTYETAEERKLRQMLIVKQSSISNALEFVKLTQADGVTIKSVLDVAQEFVDFVYSVNTVLENEPDDIPY